jgi:hypothetical protein
MLAAARNVPSTAKENLFFTPRNPIVPRVVLPLVLFIAFHPLSGPVWRPGSHLPLSGLEAAFFMERLLQSIYVRSSGSATRKVEQSRSHAAR